MVTKAVLSFLSLQLKQNPQDAANCLLTAVITLLDDRAIMKLVPFRFTIPQLSGPGVADMFPTSVVLIVGFFVGGFRSLAFLGRGFVS